MRLTSTDPVQRLDFAPNVFSFRGKAGELLSISVLEDWLIRVCFYPEGKSRLDRTWMINPGIAEPPLGGRLRDDLSPFSLPEARVKAGERRVRIETSLLDLVVYLPDFAISWSNQSGVPFASDLQGRAYSYDRSGASVFHYMSRREGERYYGLGEVSGPLDKAGRRFRMRGVDAFGYDAEWGDPLYKHFPFYITFLPEQQVAFGILYDNGAPCTFDMGQEKDNYWGAYRYYQADGGDVDYYLIYGPTIAEVVQRLAFLTGRMCMPPKWSLGYLASAMMYTELDDAENQLSEFIRRTGEHNIPCDLFHISSGYTTDPTGQRNVFTWNKSKFPDPKAVTGRFHANGIHLSANIKPALLDSHPKIDELQDCGGLIRTADGSGAHFDRFWGGQAAHVDFTSPSGYDWWKRQVRESLLEYGIDSTWNDNNEYGIWDDEAACDGFGEPVKIGLVRPLQGLLMTRASFEAQREFRSDERPYVVTRAACPGSQRYAQTWSGDNLTSWKTLRYNIPMGLGLGLSGMPNNGHDVGGFEGGPPSPELFVRWVQCGILHLRFTIHSAFSFGLINEPWMYPEMLPIVRKYIELRYRLIPYLYSWMRHSSITGDPMLRPLVYEFPQDPRCADESFQFMVGSSLLAAPVLEEGARRWDVYLPAGSAWCDFHTGQWHTGGQTITVDAPLDHLPLFARAGALIPMGKAMRYVGAEPDDIRQVLAFSDPQGGFSQFLLYEDDGHTMTYRDGAYSEVLITCKSTSGQIHLDTQLKHAGYELPYERIQFILPAGDGRKVELYGEIGSRP